MKHNKQTDPCEITNTEIEVCEILLNLPDLIENSESYNEEIVWRTRGKRSAIRLRPSPHHLQSLTKIPRIATPRSSPTSPFFISASEYDTKARYFCENIPKNMPLKEKLTKQRKMLLQTGELLTTELERVKAYHYKLEAYNRLLKAKKEETQIQTQKREFKSDLSDLYKRFNVTPLPQLLEIINQNNHYYRNQTPTTSSQRSLPDLNRSGDEISKMEHLQPLDRNIQAYR